MTDTYLIHTALAGLYLPNDAEPFEATQDDAISALLDEAEQYLDDSTVPDDEFGDDSMVEMDRAFIESLRGHEGRGDIAHKLATYGEVIIQLESCHNEFGATVTLVRVEA